MALFLSLAAGCTGAESTGSPSDAPRPLATQFLPSDDTPYTLSFEATSLPMDAGGGTVPNRSEGSDCASSFQLLFFRGLGGGVPYREPNSYVEAYLPAFGPGSTSLLPTLDDHIENSWSPPQWRIDGEIRGAFGGRAVLEAYDPDAVVLVLEDTTLCTLPLWGGLNPTEYDYYRNLATDCETVAEIRLDAVADPPGSFTGTVAPEVVHTGVNAELLTYWLDEAGNPLCR